MVLTENRTAENKMEEFWTMTSSRTSVFTLYADDFKILRTHTDKFLIISIVNIWHDGNY